MMASSALIARPISTLLKGTDGHLYLSRFENFYTYRICCTPREVRGVRRPGPF
ncbi:hypothetical protein [Nonomuraea insulae]|uniref:Uncharacterized protein n=1 Tax=Nonomuraea insulae TaxID=1616787 RepID=A0ABW1CKE4_9ACTN